MAEIAITVNVQTENGPVTADIRCDTVAMVAEIPGSDDTSMLTFIWGDSIGPIVGTREELSAIIFADDDDDEDPHSGEQDLGEENA